MCHNFNTFPSFILALFQLFINLQLYILPPKSPFSKGRLFFSQKSRDYYACHRQNGD
jgi:hypothetical protein